MEFIKNFYNESGIEYLKGKKIVRVDIKRGTHEEDEILFYLDNNEVLKMFHKQDCCEDVRIEEIAGNIYDLTYSMIINAEERKKEEETDCGSTTWTFYTIANSKAYVDIRWCGESNGYYSEGVDFELYKI